MDIHPHFTMDIIKLWKYFATIPWANNTTYQYHMPKNHLSFYNQSVYILVLIRWSIYDPYLLSAHILAIIWEVFLTASKDFVLLYEVTGGF